MFKDLKGRLLCKKCLIDDHFFRGGGSWAPDSCPKCGGTDCVMWEDLSFIKQMKALSLKNKMWKEKWQRKNQ